MNSTLELGLSTHNIDFKKEGAVQSTLLTSRAELVIYPKAEQIGDLSVLLGENGRRYHVHGGGSNSLLMGTEVAPLKTAIIDTHRLREIRVDTETGKVDAEAGSKICVVSRVSAGSQLTGLEFARDIPGTTAGAVVTDAWHPVHAYARLFEQVGISFDELPKHVSSVLRSVEVVDEKGNVATMGVDELEMRDRHSIFSTENTLFILKASFQLVQGDSDRISKTRDVIGQGRRDMRQGNKKMNPHSVGQTLGYTFVLNHPAYKGLSAAQIITQTDRLPEFLTIDGMAHSKFTPNIVGNTGHGTSEGYLRVAEAIHEAVLKEHCIDMPLEVRLVM